MLCDVQEMLPHPAADSGFGSMLFKARLSTSRLKANLEQEYGVVINFIFKALYEVGTKPISTVSIHNILPVLSSHTLYFEQIGQVCVLLTVCRDNIVARQSMQADTRLSFARRVQMTISLIGLALVLSKHMLPWNGVTELQLDADNDQALE